MNKTLTLQDYELLSAYLDSACSAKEVALIEARLRIDPEFKQALTEFKRAKLMMSKVPMKRAPHNFTLSAAPVPAQFKRSAWVPAFNFIAVAASIMLVVVFAGSKLFGLAASKMAAPEAAPMMAAAPASSASDSTLSPIIQWNQPSGLGGGGDGTGAYATGKGGGPTIGTTTVEPTLEAFPQLFGAESANPTPEQNVTSTNQNSSDLILGLAPVAERGNEINETVSNAEPNVHNFPGCLPLKLRWLPSR
jgi:hypothetical protein